MTPEQLPENKGARPPPDIDAGWHVREGEMSPDETRELGHFLYMMLFTASPTSPTLGVLLAEQMPKSKHPEDFQVETLPAILCVEKFAQIYGMNVSVLTRWTN